VVDGAAMSQDDVTLMTRVREGDDDAFAALVERYQARLQRYLRSLVRDDEKARELTQDTFVKVYRNAHRYQPMASFTTWLFRIGHNVAVSYLRKRRLVLVFGLGSKDPDSDLPATDVASEELGPHQLAEGRQLGALLRREIERLPEKMREAFILFDIEEMSIAEVARVTASPEGTVKARIFRARRALRERLQGYVDRGRLPEDDDGRAAGRRLAATDARIKP
jgi:RNA polymerase sigma-70 factor (ECF subfamily)